MFTGIVEAMGTIAAAHTNGTLRVRTPFRHIKKGESIAIDGVCLTAERSKLIRNGTLVSFSIGPETRRCTTWGRMCQKGEPVNLERSPTFSTRLGGHWVSGHVEAVGTVTNVRRNRNSLSVRISFPKALARYIVAKGSVTVDGVSLTVASVHGTILEVMIVPYTATHTTLGRKQIGDRVNLEPDMMAKYLEQLLLPSLRAKRSNLPGRLLRRFAPRNDTK